MEKHRVLRIRLIRYMKTRARFAVPVVLREVHSWSGDDSATSGDLQDKLFLDMADCGFHGGRTVITRPARPESGQPRPVVTVRQLEGQTSQLPLYGSRREAPDHILERLIVGQGRSNSSRNSINRRD